MLIKSTNSYAVYKYKFSQHYLKVRKENGAFTQILNFIEYESDIQYATLFPVDHVFDESQYSNYGIKGMSELIFKQIIQIETTKVISIIS